MLQMLQIDIESVKVNKANLKFKNTNKTTTKKYNYSDLIT